MRRILDEGRHERFREEAARLGEMYDFEIHVDRMESYIAGE